MTKSKIMAACLILLGIMAGLCRAQEIIAAATAGDLAKVRAIVEKDPSALGVRNLYGRTALCSAARDGGGDAAVIRTLIDLGADVNAADKQGWTPIELAAWRPYPAVVDVLLDAGADLKVNTAPNGKRLLGYAANGLERLFTRMVELGANLDVPTEEGGTLLYAAAGGGSRRILEILVARGFDVNARDRFGWAPLHVAAEQGRRENIAYLLEKGADLDARNALGQTPLNLAAERDDPEMVEFLKGLGGDPSAPRFPEITGLYLGRPRPGLTPEDFAPGIVSHRYRPHSTVAVSPAGDEIFWNPMIEPRGGGYSYGYLVTTRLEGGRWTYPRKAAFSAREFEDDHPVFSADGKTLYFRSDRPAGPSDTAPGPRVWSVTKTGNGWSEPSLRAELPTVSRQDGMFFGFSFDEAGNYYYNDGPDIVVSRRSGETYAPPETLGPEINFGELRGIPYVSPKGDFLIFVSDLKPFVSFRKADGGWGSAISQTLGGLNVSFTGPYLMLGGQRWVDLRAVEALRPVEAPSASRPDLAYLGQPRPGARPVRFAPEILKGDLHTSPVFTPDGREAYWSMQGATIRTTRMENGRWTPPQSAAFSSSLKDYRDPCLAPSGDRLFFLSKGRLPGSDLPEKENIWSVDRTATGWGDPRPLPAEVNSLEHHWQVSVAANGNLIAGRDASSGSWR